jgi:hypothetical protein
MYIGDTVEYKPITSFKGYYINTNNLFYYHYRFFRLAWFDSSNLLMYWGKY